MLEDRITEDEIVARAARRNPWTLLRVLRLVAWPFLWLRDRWRWMKWFSWN
jgi:hypothetical protein